MRVLSLCSGIGGIDLACEWAGFQIVGQMENNPFCQMLLRQHFPGVPLLSDLKEVATYEKEKLIETFGNVDIVVGGIPCQPFSSAGKRRGTADDRHLWPYAFALIEKLQPAWVVIENVRNFATMALDLVLSDLESLQYETQAFVFPACAAGAPHIRERCFILAYHPGFRRRTWRAESAGQQRQSDTHSNGAPLVESSTSGGFKECQEAEWLYNQPDPSNSGMAHTTGRQREQCTQFQAGWQQVSGRWDVWPDADRCSELAYADRQSLAVGQCFRRDPYQECAPIERGHDRSAGGEFATQSRMGRVLDGISARLDTARWPAGPGEQYSWEPSRTVKGKQKWRRQRLEALGNAVNPYQIYPFFELIRESETLL